MKSKLMAVAAAALFTVAFNSLAEAKPKHHKKVVAAQATMIVCNQQGCSDNVQSRSAHKAVGRQASAAYDGAVQMLSHPNGCPAQKFCACGAAVDLFGGSGRDYRALWPVSAWHKFPRTNSPSSGDVALRSHHMFVLKRHIEGDVWLTADYNSGGHRSRLHEQSIRGYTIVSPSRSHVAQLN